jgi:hypothetical protein
MTSSTTLLSSRYSCKGSSAVNQNSMWQGSCAPQARLLCYTLASMQLLTALQSGVARLGCKPKALGQDSLVYASPLTEQLVWFALEHVFAILL